MIIEIKAQYSGVRFSIKHEKIEPVQGTHSYRVTVYNADEHTYTKEIRGNTWVAAQRITEFIFENTEKENVAYLKTLLALFK